MRVHCVAAVLLFAFAAEGGVACRFKTVVTGDPLSAGESGRIWAEGRRYRLELDLPSPEPRPWDVAISDGTETRLVNLGNQTWYRDKTPHILSVLTGPFASSRIDGKADITHVHEGSDSVDGRPASKHVLRFAYRLTDSIGDVHTRAKVSGTFIIWTTPDLPPFPLEPFTYSSGLPSVDARFAEIVNDIDGIPLRLVLTATRTIEDGRPVTMLVTTEFSETKQIDVPSSRFKVPAGFREQEPVRTSAAPVH